MSIAVMGLLACSESHGDEVAPPAGASAQAGASDQGAGSSGRAGTSAKRTPQQHRELAEACDNVRPPGDPPRNAEPSGAPETCARDSDCVDGDNGRCEDFRGLRKCTYDRCFSDADCTAGPCGCEKEFWSDANVCLEGNCRTDGDCGGGGFCSPTLGGCGSYAGVIGYYCRTPDDDCTDDSDCTGPQGGGYCKYSPEVSHWVCAYTHCVG